MGPVVTCKLGMGWGARGTLPGEDSGGGWRTMAACDLPSC